tara:strand:- start:6319 stop:7497 length:1179 start_codon:yes stop_codon:yes gene_type:complete
MKYKVPIAYGNHNINANDIKNVSLAIRSKNLTNGPILGKLENNLEKYLGVKNALTCSSGTAAIHLAMLGINLKKNDIVIMPAINFIAAYNICKIMGAKIFFADVDKFSGQITPTSIKKIIKDKKLKKIKVLITMYMGGFAENVKEIYNLKLKHKFFLLEDSCHAFGSSIKYNSKKYKIGSCKFSDMATFSMHPVKTITSAEGGIVTTNNKNLANKIKLIRSHGLLRGKKEYWKYYSKYDGLNYRLSEINCALALSQLQRVDEFVKKRKKIYETYKKKLKNFTDYIFFPNYENSDGSSYHLNIVHLNLLRINGNKDKFIKYLNRYNIYPQFHYTPIYRLKMLKNIKTSKYIGSEEYFLSALSLPIYVNLNNKMLSFVVKKIIGYLIKNKKNNV